MLPDRIQLSQEMLLAAIGEDWPQDQVDAAVEILTNGEGRFPAGMRRLPPDLIRAVQRERLIVAMLRAAAEIGYRQTNVQDVINRAGVSRPTFYEHFANKEDCFLAAFDTSAQRLRRKVDAAMGEGETWRERLRLGLQALLEFVRADPGTARAVVVESRAASAEAAMRRVELLDRFSHCLDEQARLLLPADAHFTEVTASGVVGGIETLLYSCLCKEELDRLDELLPSMMYFAVLPYEGHDAAGEELALFAS